ncbi:MAG: type II toxin-antitoxin system death-on-curing family toxin [Chloroflexi bacterium]|nr:type II toxin-antitoxin system death-on-curing family toxin [Chloroflexota bacterium]
MKGVLWELAYALYDSPEEAFPSFVIENEGLLESALALPHQPYYETFEDKLAAMVRSIAANHALVDGNKRLALSVLHSTLLVNGYVWFWPNEAAEELVLRVARGETSFRWLAEYIKNGTDGPADSVRDAVDADSSDILEYAVQLMEPTVRAALIEAVEKIISGDEFSGPGSPDVVAGLVKDAYVSVAKGEHETILGALQEALGAGRTDE